MPITSITPDAEALTLTVTGEYPVPVERLWEAYADPRQIEKFWGPETWPATFFRHDMSAGGQSQYAMTGPDGSVSRGCWRFLSVEPGRRFEVEDGFADEEGNLNRSMPVIRMVFDFESTSGGSRITGTTYFPDADAMEELSAMGMLEGLRSAMGFLDEVVADDESFAADRPLDMKILDDTRVRFSRVVKGNIDEVWRAHHDPELMRRWMLGPEGWTMPVCEVGTKVGDSFHNEWEAADGSERFGLEGELLEVAPPYLEVSTERLIGAPEAEQTKNVFALTPLATGTLCTLVVTYPSAELRDRVLATGMADGMEMSYARLERDILRPGRGEGRGEEQAAGSPPPM